MVAKSSTSNRSVCWNVVFGARGEAPSGGPSPGSMLIDSINSPVPVLSMFLLCSSGVLISFSPLVFHLIDYAKVTSLLPLYTGNVSVRSQKCLRVTRFHHKNGQGLFECWEQPFTSSIQGKEALCAHKCITISHCSSLPTHDPPCHASVAGKLLVASASALPSCDRIVSYVPPPVMCL